MKTKYITRFEFDSAQYKIDNNLDSLLLQVDYKNRKYKIVSKNKLSKEFTNEVRKIARDLLKRKHGVNFAERQGE
jgi:hypothetical protein